jgi:hypothetical protein
MTKIEFQNIGLKDLACLISETLDNSGLSAILVGGACVSIYSKNRYQSYDLDFATYEDLQSIEKALKKLGFKRTGRCFSHPKCPFLIDFVNPPIAIGHESITHFETLDFPSGSLQLLSPTDSVKDRLASYFYWNDEQALEQALLVANNNKIDLKDIKRWAKAEGFLSRFNHFLEKLNQ